MSQSIEVVDLVEPKLKSLKEEQEAHIKFFNECGASIKKMRAERKNSLAKINQIAGAIAAFTEVIKVSKTEPPVEVIPAERA